MSGKRKQCTLCGRTVGLAQQAQNVFNQVSKRKRLTFQECNRDHIRNAFSSAVIKNKILTPHQTGQLVSFMMDHSQRIFCDPPDLQEALALAEKTKAIPGTGKFLARFWNSPSVGNSVFARTPNKQRWVPNAEPLCNLIPRLMNPLPL